jgi:hypothetical protein
MLKLYKYLYYRIYSWNLRTWGKNDVPEWNALFGVSFMMFLNLLTIFIILQFWGIDIFSKYTVPTNLIVIVILMLMGINYYIFLYKKKYKLLEKKFANENTKTKNRNLLLLWVYFILSIALPSILTYLSIKYLK